MKHKIAADNTKIPWNQCPSSAPSRASEAKSPQ